MGPLESISSWAFNAAHYLFTKEEEDSQACQGEPAYYSEAVEAINEPPLAIDKKAERKGDCSDQATPSQLRDCLTKVTQGLDREKLVCKKELQAALLDAKKWESEIARLLQRRHVLDKEQKAFPKLLPRRLKQRKLAVEKELSQTDAHCRLGRQKLAAAKNYAQKQTEKLALIETLLSEAKKILDTSVYDQVDIAQMRAKVIGFEKTLLKHSQAYAIAFDRNLLVGGLKV